MNERSGYVTFTLYQNLFVVYPKNQERVLKQELNLYMKISKNEDIPFPFGLLSQRGTGSGKVND